MTQQNSIPTRPHPRCASITQYRLTSDDPQKQFTIEMEAMIKTTIEATNEATNEIKIENENKTTLSIEITIGTTTENTREGA